MERKIEKLAANHFLRHVQNELAVFLIGLAEQSAKLTEIPRILAGTTPGDLVPMKNFLFWQEGANEGFHEVGAVSGEPFHQLHVGRGAAFADYDNDGDVDIFIVNQEGHGQLLRNDGGNRKNWIKVRVKCTKSNRTGFGTKVEIEAGGVTQAQEIGGQTSYLSQNFREAHFGLNHEKEAVRLKVTFPSGVVHEMEHVAANKIVTVRE